MADAHSSIRLAPDVHAVGVNGDLVFLDVRRDAYVCLPDGEQMASLTDDLRALQVAHPDVAAELLTSGLAVSGPAAAGDADTARIWVAPKRSALRDSYPAPRLGDAAEIAVALADLAVGYRGRPFAAVVQAARRPRGDPPRLSRELLETVDAFHRWAPFAPTSGKCLLRAFMLLRLLRRRGQDALWVFGVRTWPFHAHCWLQCEDLALDEEPDRIRAFTPILIL